MVIEGSREENFGVAIEDSKGLVEVEKQRMKEV
jgi:hypothetical protein